MAITKAQAISEPEFHIGCTASVGLRGGITHRPEVWRRNGQTQTWKTRPDEYRVPVKYGLRSTAQLMHYNAANVYTRATCPVCTAVARYHRDPCNSRGLLQLRAALADLKRPVTTMRAVDGY